MTDKHGEYVGTLAIQDVVNGVVARDIFYLTTTEVVFRSQRVDIQVAQFRNHRVPDMSASILGRLLKLDFLEESAFKGLVHILLQIGGGYHDAVELFHFLQDDVLQCK